MDFVPFLIGGSVISEARMSALRFPESRVISRLQGACFPQCSATRARQVRSHEPEKKVRSLHHPEDRGKPVFKNVAAAAVILGTWPHLWWHPYGGNAFLQRGLSDTLPGCYSGAT